MAKNLCFALAVMVATTPATASPSGRDEAWAVDDIETARASAAQVVVAFIESARQPRGSIGHCPADGKVIQVERGARFRFGDDVSAWVPCAAFPGNHPFEPKRPIPMWPMHDDTYARLHFNEAGWLIDYEPLQLAPAKRDR